MPRSSRAVTMTRREEIVDACAGLYETMSFRDMTMQEIGRATSFTRTSIYNYFHTKEEIFLALMQREYEAWISELQEIRKNRTYISRRSFAGALAWTLQHRKTMLKLLAMNHYDVEEKSRLERIVEFRRVYLKAQGEIETCLRLCEGRMSEQEIEDFIYSFFPFLFGIYPYTEISQKQREAMEQLGASVREQSIYDVVYRELKRLLCVCDREEGDEQR